MMNAMKKIFFLLLIVGGGMQGFAMPLQLGSVVVTLQLGSALQSNMVIQQNHPFNIWGRAAAGETVQIRADWLADALSVKPGADCQFLGIIPVPAVQSGALNWHTTYW